MGFSVYSNKGKVRNDNEDSYLVKEGKFPLIAVADGMGGHQAGELASSLAVDLLDNYDFNYQNDLLNELIKVFNLANEEILLKAEEDLEYSGMGTTLTAAIIYYDVMYIAHIGDTRIYLYRNNQLYQVTTDHSLVNELLKQKQISCKEAFNHPHKNIITQALGSIEELEIESKKVDLLAGDRLLFSTDGLHDMLRFNEIKKFLGMDKNLEDLSELMGKQAMKNGGSDNITLVLFDIN
ncbi:Stp1/IreP family PP2C-type Ser/Thr phosphatase [Natronospora cellulosivora (SeqCode)]